MSNGVSRSIAVSTRALSALIGKAAALCGKWADVRHVEDDYFPQSRGRSVDTLNRYAAKTLETKNSLASMLNESQQYFDTVCSAFCQADQDAAKTVGGP